MAAQVDLTINTRANTAELKRATDEAQEFINTLKLGVGIDLGGKLVDGIAESAARFKESVVEGVKFNATVQDAQLAIAAMLKSFQPDRFKSFDAAMAESGRGVAALRKAALDTSFSFETLLETQQSISGPLAGGGVKDLQKQVDLVVLLSQAAKTLNLPQQLFQSDARDLVEGRVGRTLLGRGLGITDAEINQATKEGKLYDFLSQRLSAYGDAGVRSLDNLSTRSQKLYDRLQQLEGVSTQGIFDQVSNLAKDLNDAIADPEFETTAKAVGSELEVITGGVAGLIRTIADHPEIFAVIAQGATTFGLALALLNLPRVVTGLIQLATSAVPALANLAALGTAARTEGAAIGAATDKVNANTDSLRANAAAAGAAAESQVAVGGAAASGQTTPGDAATQASTDATIANTNATLANNEAVAASAEVTQAANAATLSSNELTEASTAVTGENTASTETNTGAINQSNAAAVANNEETQISNALTEESTAVTEANTASTLRSNAAAEAALAIGQRETAIATEENALTAEGAALDDQATQAVIRSNAAADQAVAIGKQETTIVAKENLLTDESTAKTILNTAAVKQSNQVNTQAIAVGAELIAQEDHEAEAMETATGAVAAETAAVEANTAAKKQNVAVPTAGVGALAEDAVGAATKSAAGEAGAALFAAGGILSAGTVSAALTVILSLGEIYAAIEGYLNQIHQANDDLSKQLTDQLGTMEQQVETVSTQADKAALIASLKEQEQKVEEQIAFAKSNSLETDGRTIDILTQYQEGLRDALLKTEGISDAQLNVRDSTQKAANALDTELEALGKLTQGYDKAILKYQEFKAQQDLKDATNDAQREDARQRLAASQLAQINAPLQPAHQFPTYDSAQTFVNDAPRQNAILTDAQNRARQDAQDAAVQAKLAQIEVDKAKAAKAQADKSLAQKNEEAGKGDAPVSQADFIADYIERTRATTNLATAQQHLKDAQEAVAESAQRVRDADKVLADHSGIVDIAASVVEKGKDLSDQQKQQTKANADSQFELNDKTNKELQAANEKAYKDGLISLDEYYKTARHLLELEHEAEIAKINEEPQPTDTVRTNKLIEADNTFQAKSRALLADVQDKGRQDAVTKTQEQARQLSLQAEAARAAGNVDLAEQLDEQVAKLQKIAEIEGRASISAAERRREIDLTTASMDRQFEIAQRQKDAELDLETKEKQTADALSKLQAQRQRIESSNALPDAKNDALRQNYLEENQAIEQQIALLEQRRQLALEDPTKSPNDRALTAAGIDQQIDQAKQQYVGNQIAADKLTFTGQFTNELAAFASSFGSTAQQAAGVVTGTLGTAVSSISKNLAGIIEGTEGVKQGFIAMAQEVVSQLIELAIKLAITLALQEALDVASIAGAPAAGAAAGLAAAGVAGASSLAGGFAEGGLVPGAPSSRDNRIATIATGEYVARAAAVSHYGPGLFEALNRMAIPRHAMTSFDMPVRARRSLGFASGGLVAPLPSISGQALPSAAKTGNHFNVALLNSRSAQNEWARKGDGRKITIDLIDGRLRDLGVMS